MVELQRKLLDALMGSNRNGAIGTTSKRFTDEDVCRFFLVGLCPHELFTNTKMDLGDCPKLHSTTLQADYEEELKQGRDYGFLDEVIATLRRYVDDCDRKVEKARKRLEESNPKADNEIAAEIKQLLAEAERLGTSYCAIPRFICRIISVVYKNTTTSWSLNYRRRRTRRRIHGNVSQSGGTQS